MKLKHTLAASAILAALVAAGFWVHNQQLPRAVTATVGRGTVTRVAPANILVTEAFSMEIRSEAGGRVLKGGAQPGQAVKAGEVLYQIDTRDIELEIERAESERRAFKESAELGPPGRFALAAAEEAVANSERLAGQGRISRQELERARRALEETRHQLEAEKIADRLRLDSLENTLKAKRRALGKMTVRAAGDGTVSEVFAREGDLVGAGSVLCRVISRERLVQAQVSEEYFSGVRPGLPVNMQLLGYGGQQFRATVERVLPAADEKTRRHVAYLRVEMPEERLVPGLTGEAGITVGQRDNVLVADRRALLGNTVFVVRDGRAVKTVVRTGFSGTDTVEILEGLKEGDEVIVVMPASFRDGQRVRAAGGRRE